MNDLFNEYSKEVMKYFKNPKNIGVIKDADGVGTVGNPRCGDVMKVYLKIGCRPILGNPKSKILNPKKIQKSKSKTQKTEEYIKDIKVQTLGCGAAVATSSIATEMVKGRSIKEALKLTNLAVAKALRGLPKMKMHCSLLAKQGIQKAIEDYKSKSKIKSSKF